MKKKIIGFITLCLMLVVFSGNAFAMIENNIDIYIDNSKLSIPQEYGKAFIDDKNRTQIPLRIVSESLGYTVEWNQADWSATINGNVVVKIGEKEVQTPNGTVVMDTEAVTINGRTMVPLRFVMEALGYEGVYKYQSGIHRIDILSPVVVDGDVIVIDISNAKVDRYKDKEGGFRPDLVGSVDNSMMGTYNDSSYEDDIALFNKALKGTTWRLSEQGNLQGEAQKYDDPNVNLKVKRDSDGNPVINLRNWSINQGDDLLTPIIMTRNVFMESCKYYSETPSDGEAIYCYVDQALKQKKNIASDKVLQFGKTKIKISDPGVFGIDVTFVD